MDKGTLFPLFPSAANETRSEEGGAKHDWLENKSFTTRTADKVLEFQQELQKLQTGEGTVTQGSFSQRTRTEQVAKKESNYCSRSRSQSPKTGPSRSSSSEPGDLYGEYGTKNRQTQEYSRKKKRRKHASDRSDSEERKRKHKHKKHKKNKQKKLERDRSPEKVVPGLFNSTKIFLDEVADVAPQHAFKLDRVPDKNSWAYGSLYSGHVANYKSVCDVCVGSEGRQPVYLKERTRKDKETSERYYSKENRKLVRQLPVETITSAEKAAHISDDVSQMFIHIHSEHSSGKVAMETDVRQKILDSATSRYVQGKGKAVINSEPRDETQPDPSRLKVAEYNKQLREDPTNVKLWLKFVKFQDQMLEEEGRGEVDESGKTPTARGMLDKKLSILDKALEANPGNIELLLAKIEVNAEVSDSVKINKELEQLLFVHSENAELWKYYLTFNQTRLSIFTVTKLTKLYHKCFKTLIGILEGRVQTHSKPENLEKQILEIFFQYCYFLKQSGYKEKAVASFQAFLEFNIFCPPAVERAPRETKMAAFEEFWDSNVARIGLVGAKGWKNWFEQKDNIFSPEVQHSSEAGSLEEQEEAVINRKLSKHVAWLEIESLREQHHLLPWLPGEGQTEEDCEDVERLIMFDDISHVLFTINSEENLLICLNAFIQFLGFHSKSDIFYNFESNGLIPECIDDLSSHRETGFNVEVLRQANNEVTRSVAIETLRLVIPTLSCMQRTNMSLTLSTVQMSRYQKEVISKHDKKEMRAVLKNMLKEESCRNSLFIWSEYIDLERSIGKAGEAKSIIETALSMYSGSSVEQLSEPSVGLLSLYAQYCDILLEIPKGAPACLLPRAINIDSSTKKTVLSVLSCMIAGEKFVAGTVTDLPGAVILKAKSALLKLCNSFCENIGKMGQIELIKEQVKKTAWCAAIFMYCKSDFQSSLKVYDSVITSVSSTNELLDQELHMDRLRLVVYHMSKTSSPLRILREILDHTLERYPENPVFLSLFLDIERKSRISGRINTHLDRWCRTVSSPTPTVLGVAFQIGLIEEIRKSAVESNVSESGFVHRMRHWLEHSLAQSKLQHCPVLWRLYLQLEAVSQNTRRLKGVFYRAMQQCPWAKSIYMDGIRLFGSKQLQEIVDLMTEKEIRIQIPVEELDILVDT